jgi:hypothetical protein
LDQTARRAVFAEGVCRVLAGVLMGVPVAHLDWSLLELYKE